MTWGCPFSISLTHLEVHDVDVEVVRLVLGKALAKLEDLPGHGEDGLVGGGALDEGR